MKRIHKSLSIFIIVLSTFFAIGSIQNYDLKNNNNFNLTSSRVNDYFTVNSFYIVEETITSNSFQFWINVELNNGDAFLPLANNLVLASNFHSLDTNLQLQSNNYFLYEVNNLKDDTFYSNFTVSIFGYPQVEYVNGFLVTKKIKLNAFQISGIIIGVLAALLIISLTVLFIIKLKNGDEEVVEEQEIYKEHHTYIDENGDRFEWIDEEWVPLLNED